MLRFRQYFTLYFGDPEETGASRGRGKNDDAHVAGVAVELRAERIAGCREHRVRRRGRPPGAPGRRHGRHDDGTEEAGKRHEPCQERHPLILSVTLALR